MPLPLRESQLATELAEALRDFLPGKPHPYASADLSFPGAARAAHLSTPWPGGSKQPALAALLGSTLERERHRFCALVTEIVRRAMAYRANKAPLTREEVARVNEIVARIGFRIPELHAPAFLDALPRAAPAAAPVSPAAAAPAAPAAPAAESAAVLAGLTQDLVALAGMEPVSRGTAFERFLSTLFDAFGLASRGAFSLRGEQIDGSFTLDGAVYLLEAKWQGARTGNRDLAAFNDQVGARAAWARGLFLSYAGFSAEGLDAFARGRSTRILCMDATDLYMVLSGSLDLCEVLRAKARRAVEETRAFVPVRELFPDATLR